MDLVLNGTQKLFPNIPSTSSSLVSISACEWRMECLLGKCHQCQDLDSFVENLIPLEEDDDHCVSYFQWNAESKQELIQMSIHEVCNLICDLLPPLRKHSFIAKYQLQQAKYLKTIMVDEEALMQEDFSENYSMKQQNEIMSAHWVSSSVTLFTATIYRQNKFSSYVVVSDEVAHDKYSVWTYNHAILEDSVSKDGNISKLHMFSDGAGGQFKNRFTLSTILDPAVLHPSIKEMDWSFFATSHGKGPIDGLGGTVKRAVWRRTLQDKAVVNNAVEFAAVAAEACPNIRILLVRKEHVEEQRKLLGEKWQVNNPKPIPHTHQIHFVKKKNCTHVKVSQYSPFSSNVPMEFQNIQLFQNSESEPHMNNSQIDISVPEDVEKGKYVVVDYDGSHYAGIVMDINQANLFPYTINVMHQCLGGWKWPEKDDSFHYSKAHIVKVLRDGPQPVNNRGVYSFSEDI